METYEYTRSIGFSLKWVTSPLPIPQSETGNLDDFIEAYRLLIDLFEEMVRPDCASAGEQAEIEVKYPWLKLYAREQYYAPDFQREIEEQRERNGDSKRFSIKTAPFLSTVWEGWIARNRTVLEELERYRQRGEHEQVRNADMAMLLRRVCNTDHLPFIRDFARYATHKSDVRSLHGLQEQCDYTLERAQKLLEHFAPDETRGVEIARASMNFFTINKIPKDFGEKKEELNRQLGSPYRGNLNPYRDFLGKIGFTSFVQRRCGKRPELLPLRTLYEELKCFKAEQKSDFLKKVEMLPQGCWRTESGEDEVRALISYAKEHFPLFLVFNIKEKAGIILGVDELRSGEILRDILHTTREIKELEEQREQAKRIGDNGRMHELSEALRHKKQKRGKYFSTSEREVIKNYKVFCNKIFRNVAMRYGKYKAQLRAIEQEEIEARLLRYWAFLADHGGAHYIVLVPKDRSSRARRWLMNRKRAVRSGEWKAYFIHSLTLRAAEKLLRKQYPQEIPQFNRDDQELIAACQQKILQGTDDRIKVEAHHFNVGALMGAYADREAFRQDLERECYRVEEAVFSDEVWEILRKEYGAKIARLSSYDLERSLRGGPREHTVLWRRFWEKKNRDEWYPLRINPEIRIFYRNALPQKDPRKSRNRFSVPRYRIQFSLTENAAHSDVCGSFRGEKDLQESIATFNRRVADEWIKERQEERNLWHYGIDRGNQELATLGIVRWSEEKYRAVIENKDGSKEAMAFSKPEFAQFPAYTIINPSATAEITVSKNGDTKRVNIMDNPSYFLDRVEDRTVFKKEQRSFLDLTTAKVFKGKLITNGDVKTYLNLKLANGKRRLYAEYSNIDPKARVEWVQEWHPAWEVSIGKKSIYRGAFVVRAKSDEGEKGRRYIILCYFTERQKELFGESVFNELGRQLQKQWDLLREDPHANEITIDKINHLRDAIAANIVGVISHLFKEYPGIINLEDLRSEGDIGRHFRNNNENIARRLEWALYRKFQKEGLVPPRLRNTIFLREKMKICELGIIHFVPTTCSSARCPVCLERAESKRRKEEKWRSHHFTCTNPRCGFSTESIGERHSHFSPISNSDEVASCNIANPSFFKRELECDLMDQRHEEMRTAFREFIDI